MESRSSTVTAPSRSSSSKTHGSTGCHWIRILNGRQTCRRAGRESPPRAGTVTRLSSKTTGFNGYTRLDTVGHPHSKDMKYINTFTRTDSLTILHTVTVHDPKAYTHDWMNARTWTLKPAKDVIMEYACEENNVSLQHGNITKWKYPETVD